MNAPPTILDADEILEGLRTQRTQRLEEDWIQYEREVLYASDIGECDRQLVLHTLGWRLRSTPSQWALENMEQGREAEKLIVGQMRKEGTTVVQDQAPFKLVSRITGKPVLKGRIEGLLQYRLPGQRAQHVPFEVKDTSAWKFEALREESDLLNDQFTRKWWRQFQAYLIGFEYLWGIFIIAHRGARRMFRVDLDWGAAETLWTRAEAAAETVDALKTTPLDDLDAALTERGVRFGPPAGCRYCDMYRRVCFPVETAPGDAPDMRVLPEELEPRVTRLLELKDAKLEYDRHDRWLAREVPRGTHAITGDTIISGEWQKQKTKPRDAVPAMPATPAGTRSVWKRSIFIVHGSAAAPETEDGE